MHAASQPASQSTNHRGRQMMFDMLFDIHTHTRMHRRNTQNTENLINLDTSAEFVYHFIGNTIKAIHLNGIAQCRNLIGGIYHKANRWLLFFHNGYFNEIEYQFIEFFNALWPLCVLCMIGSTQYFNWITVNGIKDTMDARKQHSINYSIIVTTATTTTTELTCCGASILFPFRKIDFSRCLVSLWWCQVFQLYC